MLQLTDFRTGYGRSEVIHGASIEAPSDGVADRRRGAAHRLRTGSRAALLHPGGGRVTHSGTGGSASGFDVRGAMTI